MSAGKRSENLPDAAFEWHKKAAPAGERLFEINSNPNLILLAAAEGEESYSSQAQER